MNDNHSLRLIFPTQSIGIRVFWCIYRALLEDGGLGPCGFFVTNRYEYSLFNKQNPNFEQAGADIVFEWDLLSDVERLSAPDIAKIADWEKAFVDSTLWNALIIDRRLDFTLKAQFRQSFMPSYTHEALLKILQVGIDAIDKHFERVKPHAVVGLNAVTLYDYLYYLMAQKRNIPYFQLKLTRVRNYVSLYTEPFDISPHIVEAFRRIRAGNDLSETDLFAVEEAKTLLVEINNRSLTYEGAIKRVVSKDKRKYMSSKIWSNTGIWLEYLKLDFSMNDPHYPTFLMSVFYTKIVRPLRRRLLANAYDFKNPDEFISKYRGRYAVFPLNTEPEVALLAYGRPYRNQIETVRNLAVSLPVGWKLLVKEHPNAHGYRSIGYYRKLRQIPNVVLAGPNVDSNKLIEGSGLVLVVFGTIGLEAIIKGKPLVTLCQIPYELFPNNMVRYVNNLWELGNEIQDILSKYEYDEVEVEAFLAAHIATGIRANLFTELLGKGGRETVAMKQNVESQYANLAYYIRQRVREEIERHQASRRQYASIQQKVSYRQ